MPGRTKDEVGVDVNVESEAKGIGSDWGRTACPPAMIYGRNGFLMTTTTTAACTNYKAAQSHTHTVYRVYHIQRL